MKGLLMAVGGAAIGLGFAGMVYHQRRSKINRMMSYSGRSNNCGGAGASGGQGQQSSVTTTSNTGTTVESYPTNLVEQQVDNNISPVQQYSPSPTLDFSPVVTITVPGAASLDNVNGCGAQNVW